MKPEASQALEGRTIADKFLIETMIGQGAMGAVYRARWIALDKVVALKVMNPEIAGDASFTGRFHREAKAASKLDHPNSVRVLDFGQEPDGLLYIAMEYLAGRDLLALMRAEWPLPTERVVSILMQTLSALTVAHEHGIVHRDLKPENIMVLAGTDDEARPLDVVKVCDFGIAKIMNDRGGQSATLAKGPVTTSGTLVGTPEYMSPEQGRGDTLDARSDLYSVGVILFHLLTGKVPFVAENAVGIILKHITDDPPRPTLLTPQADPRLEAICLKAMRKRREERYPSAREMRADLRAVRDQVRGIPSDPNPPVPSSPQLPQIAVAPTVHDLSAHASGERAIDVHGMPTATGLAVSAVASPRRAWVAAIVVGATLVGVGVGAFVFTRLSHDRALAIPASNATARSASTAPSQNPPEVELTPLLPAGTALQAPPSEAPAAPARPAGAHGHSPHVSGTERAPLPVAAAAAPSVAAPPLAAPPAAAAISPAPPAAPPPVADTPAYDPSQATVDVGSVTPSNVNGDAVRTAMRALPLTNCYRNALRARGRRAFGSATLNLSIDENGKVSGAILTGAEWLPEMTRCVQGGASGMQLRAGAVSAGGGTAEVWLSFRAP